MMIDAEPVQSEQEWRDLLAAMVLRALRDARRTGNSNLAAASRHWLVGAGGARAVDYLGLPEGTLADWVAGLDGLDWQAVCFVLLDMIEEQERRLAGMEADICLSGDPGEGDGN